MTIDREIKYSRASGDYDCFVDGRYIGSRPNYSAGEQLCNQVVYDLLADGAALTAAQLDGDPPGENPLGDTEGDPEDPGEWHSCKMNVLGTRWTDCGAPAEGPCYCDVMVIDQPAHS